MASRPATTRGSDRSYRSEQADPQRKTVWGTHTEGRRAKGLARSAIPCKTGSMAVFLRRVVYHTVVLY